MRRQRSKAATVAAFRSGLVACASAAVLLSATPSHAFLGSIKKAVGSVIGGGEGDACGGGMMEEIISLGITAATGVPVTPEMIGTATKAVGVGSGGGSGGGKSSMTVPEQGQNPSQPPPPGEGGCPVVESFPGAVEIQAIKQAVETALQTKQMVEQTVYQGRMLRHSPTTLVPWLLGRAERFLALFGVRDAIPWSLDEVIDIFNETYPEPEIVWFDNPEDLREMRERQEKLAREASIQSKEVSASLAEDIGELSAQLERLEAARAACEGQTCVGDINAQIGMVSTQLQAKTALMQSSHFRMQEAQIDLEREERTRADAEWSRTMRRVNDYGVPGS